MAENNALWRTDGRLHPLRTGRTLALAGCLGAVVVGGLFLLRNPMPPSPQAPGQEIALPQPSQAGGMTLVEALTQRRSQRAFAAHPVTADQVGQLCWAAQGVTNTQLGFRTAPSAGGLYPLTVYLVDQRGVAEYLPARHALRLTRRGDLRSQLQAAALDQPAVGLAPVCLILVMEVERTATKYGNRAERYCLLEAGHAAQNVLLQATALGLVGVPVGAFDDRQVAVLLGLPPQQRPVYLLPLGWPHGG